jgi:hypothetical protein
VDDAPPALLLTPPPAPLTITSKYTPAVLRDAIESVLGAIPFEGEITIAYCMRVKQELNARLPGAACECYRRGKSLVVDARDGSARGHMEIVV